MAVASDPRVCKPMAIDLGIFCPCRTITDPMYGRIIWHLESDEPTAKREKYLVRIFVADISPVDQKRLDLLIDQSRASVSSGRIQKYFSICPKLLVTPISDDSHAFLINQYKHVIAIDFIFPRWIPLSSLRNAALIPQ